MRLEIRWPKSPEPQVFEDVPLDAWLAVREGDKAFTRLERRRFQF